MLAGLFARFKNGRRPHGLDRLPARDEPTTWTEWAILRPDGTAIFDGNAYDDPERRRDALQQADTYCPGVRHWIGYRTAAAGPWMPVYDPARHWVRECNPEDPSDDSIQWRARSPKGDSEAVNQYAAHAIAAAMQAAGAGHCHAAYRTLAHTPWMRADNEGRSAVGAAGYGRHVGSMR